MFQCTSKVGGRATTHHERQVELLPVVSKMPEALQARRRDHDGEVVLVRSPEEALVRRVGEPLRLLPPSLAQQDQQNRTQQPAPRGNEHGNKHVSVESLAESLAE